jgi:hypothetical protein
MLHSSMAKFRLIFGPRLEKQFAAAVFQAAYGLFVFRAAEAQMPELAMDGFAFGHIGFLSGQRRAKLFEMFQFVCSINGDTGIGCHLCDSRYEHVPFLPPALNLFATLV